MAVDNVDAKSGTPARPPATAVRGTSDGNQFGLDLYERFRRESGNIVFSPFSVRVALGMTYGGARGATAEEMRRVLRVGSSNDAFHQESGRTIKHLNTVGTDKVEMSVANSLWSQSGVRLLRPFVALIRRHYGGTLYPVDFRRAEDTRQKINRWVQARTKNKIRELIPPEARLMDLVLVNAVYFKGNWVLRFPKTATRQEPFYLEGRKTVQAPLMMRKGKVRYSETPMYQALELEYEGRDVLMLVMLPKEREGLRALEADLSAKMIADCVARMAVHEVEVHLPKFKMTWGSKELNAPLQSLGMVLAFTQARADFSGIDGQRGRNGLFISQVFHKAFIEVNEEGTEAAAATAVGMSRASLAQPKTVFRADHPFLFAIRDRKSGTILFLGRVVDPSQSR